LRSQVLVPEAAAGAGVLLALEEDVLDDVLLLEAVLLADELLDEDEEPESEPPLEPSFLVEL